MLDGERLELDRLEPPLRVLVFFAAGFRAVPLLFDLAADALFAAERFGFAELDRLAVDRVLLLPELADADDSADHLPLITRCAASATASAINDPSLVALCIIDFAAFSVVSAASIPASRIALRAFGLAAIAAAAAVNPAASISLLIAALASFSLVDLLELEDVEPEPELFEDRLEGRAEDLDPVLLLDFAIANLLLAAAIDNRPQQRFRFASENAADSLQSQIR